jgi:two-component system, sensor histidine kinase and response regulator
MSNENVESQNIPDILIVDDTPANLILLGHILKDAGYKVRPVPSGMLALQVAEKEKPDLILLDIMMPEMDGFEVCNNLKNNPELADVPIIFISASNNTKDIVRALISGGADYISKPFQAEEVLARVATHLKIYQQRKELIELNATKDKFFSIIAHDLRGPLGGFMRLTELMADESLNFSPEEKKELTQNLSHSARNIFNLLENLLEWSQMQRGHTTFNPQELGLKYVVTDCLKVVVEAARKKSINVTVEISDEIGVFGDVNMLQTVFRNLVSNAIKFTPKDGKITISAAPDENNLVIIEVKDTGIGMDSKIVGNIFRIDVNNRRPGTEGELSTGLGLLICKDFVEKHRGRLWVESIEGKGSSFFFTIPRES